MTEKTNNILYDIAVIGAGGAGQMALLRAVLNHLHTVVFMGDAKTTRSSRATWVNDVENIPGMFHLHRPITRTTKETVDFIRKRKDLSPYLTEVKKAAVNIQKKEDYFVISTDQEIYYSRYVVLCTGTMDVQPHINGSIEPILPFANKGDVLYCIYCDGHRTAGHSTAVIGHRSMSGWIAVMLKERYDLPQIYVLPNDKPFEGSGEVKQLLDQYEIEIVEGGITRILGDAKSGLKGFEAGGKTVEATRAFVVLGSIVHNQLAKQLGVKLSDREHVLTDENGATSVEGFYAAGDLVEGKKKQVYTAWDLAVDAVIDIDEKIRTLKRSGKYRPQSV